MLKGCCCKAWSVFGKKCNEGESNFRKEGLLKAPKKYIFGQRFNSTWFLSLPPLNFSYTCFFSRNTKFTNNNPIMSHRSRLHSALTNTCSYPSGLSTWGNRSFQHCNILFLNCKGQNLTLSALQICKI